MNAGLLEITVEQEKQKQNSEILSRNHNKKILMEEKGIMIIHMVKKDNLQ